MALLPRLHDMSACAERDCGVALGQCTRLLGETIAAEMVASDDTREREVKAVDDAALNCWQLARTFDAAQCLRERVLEARHQRVNDLVVDPTWAKMQARIGEAFESRDVADRGFVYVAWTDVPERYYYVGMAESSGRLDLARHGKLARATGPGHARLLSLVFPGQSRNRNLRDVEASVIELVRHVTNRLPELNTDPGTVPHMKAGKALDRLGSRIMDIGKWFSEG